ncbi:MAG: fibronectin type III domain-containing protein [Acidobacteria bacterium]|nr:fibronectin type III domain-containing protein [Acidobacteriota bacterium]
MRGKGVRDATLGGAACGRCGALACSLVLLAATAAEAQRFVSLETRDDNRSVSARAAGRTIVVDRDLVRSGPQRLELETPDSRVLAAERSVFEDRGDGNVMWSGSFPGAGFDSVVLTVQDGHLQGMFGEPGRAAYWIRAGLDGMGLMEQPVAGRLAGGVEFCAGGVVPDLSGVAAGRSKLVEPPTVVRSESNHDRIDMVVLYTVEAAEAWESFGYGTPRASIQASIDFLNLVLRNNSMPAAAHLVHMAEAPAALDGQTSVLGRLSDLREAAELRAAHQADMVHLFVGEQPRDLGYCGIAYILTRAGERNDWANAYGVSAATCSFPAQEGAYPYFGQVFAHEVGHNLGANHDPANTGISRDVAVRPWAFGHFDISTAPTVETIMSYRSYVPRQWVPFFSSARIKPNGWTIGKEDERENERALYDTVPLGVQYSDHMPDPAEFDDFPSWVPEAPANLTVEPTSSTSARLEWEDRSDDELGFRIHARAAGDRWRIVDAAAVDSESIEVTGLKREGRYTFRVRAYHNLGGADSDLVTVTLRAGGAGPDPDPGPGPGGINVPDDLTAAAFGSTSIELTWAGVTKGTVEIEARTWTAGWAQVMTADATAGQATVGNLEAEAPYTFRLRTRSDGKVSAWSGEVSATTGAVSGACRTGEQYLCLAEGRFEVQAHWKNHLQEGDFGIATSVPIEVSDESGMFWFFNSSNIELVVKTLDGRGINGHYWVFFGALSNVEYWVTVRDTEGGGRRTYHNPPAENCGQSDTMAFVPAAASSASAAGNRVPDPGFDLMPLSLTSLVLPGVASAQEGGGNCEAGETRLCLRNGRFSVEVELVDPADMQRKAGKVVSSVGTNETGFFWFFSPTNVELATKLLDGRSQNGKYWFLYGGLSDVEYTVTLTDTVTGESRPYHNKAGSLCGGIDINALPK